MLATYLLVVKRPEHGKSDEQNGDFQHRSDLGNKHCAEPNFCLVRAPHHSLKMEKNGCTVGGKAQPRPTDFYATWNASRILSELADMMSTTFSGFLTPLVRI